MRDPNGNLGQARNEMPVRHWGAVLLIFGLVSIALGLPAVAQTGDARVFEKSSLVIITKSGEHRFSVEIAADDTQRAQGLMFRPVLAPDHGMLFDFKRDLYISMWMRNTLIPLDMLFLDKTGKVTFIHENAVPGSLDTIQSPGRNRAVLELPGGTVARLRIAENDVVQHAIFQ